MATKRLQRGLGRGALMAGTLRLISSRGIHAITMRDIAAESGLSLGSTTYHFTDRAALLAAALGVYVSDTEKIVDDALATSRKQRDPRAAGGVHSAIAALFADRQAVMIRYELRLEATRDDTLRDLHARSAQSIRRLIAAALRADRRSTSIASVGAVIADLEAAAIDAAITHREPTAFTAATTTQLAKALSAGR